MKKFQLLGVVMVAVCAVGVLIASSASAAVVTLLAEWLINTVAIAEGAQVPTETSGEILLEDSKTLLGKSDILCSGIFLGTSGFDGLDVVSEVLNLALEAISSTELSGLALSCEEKEVCAGAEVWPSGLPWNSLLELVENGTEVTFADVVSAGPSGKAPGWEVHCKGTITEPTDTCTAAQGVTKIGLSGTALTGEFNEAYRTLLGAAFPLATCTQSKEATGHVVSETPGTIKDTEGGTIDASSETNEA